MNRRTTHPKDAQHKTEQNITREHAKALLAGIDDRFIHTVKIGPPPQNGTESTRDFHYFGLLESHEMLYSTSLYQRPDVYQIKSLLTEQEVAKEIEHVVQSFVRDYTAIPGGELPVKVEYQPAESLQSADLDDIEGVTLVNEGEKE